jgi:aldehyde dehydrogenase (NAD+)
MSYIESGKAAGDKVEIGGERHGSEGYSIKPTIYTNVDSSMKIVHEEIFGPVCVLIKFKDEEDVIKQANDTLYGLAAAVFHPGPEPYPQHRTQTQSWNCMD